MASAIEQLDNLQLKDVTTESTVPPATCPFAASAKSGELPPGHPAIPEPIQPEQREEVNRTPVPTPPAKEPATCPFPQSSPSHSASTLVETTQEIDPELLKTSLEDRVRYLRDFLNFHAHDAELIKKVGPLVYGLIPKIVDDLYAKLFEFDVTKQVFMQRNEVSP